MPSPGHRTTRSADPRFSPPGDERRELPRPIVVVAQPDLADRIQRLIPPATPSPDHAGEPLTDHQTSSRETSSQPASPTPVIRVASFLSALGEAGRRELAAVVGPARSLSGMAGPTAESLRKLAPHARLILLRDPTPPDPQAAAEQEQDIRVALESGFDLALTASPDLATLAAALELPAPAAGLAEPPSTPATARTPHPQPPAREPVLRRADPTDLSTLDLSTPASLAPAEADPSPDPGRPVRSADHPAAAALLDAAEPPTYQATLDAVLPPDFRNPPSTPIVPPSTAADHGPTATPSPSPDPALGDTDLVNVILHGHGNILPLALRMIRHQSDLNNVDFANPEQTAPEHHAAVRVGHDEHTFGTLHAPTPAPGINAPPAEVASAAGSPESHATLAQLTVWADWLVHWLRLEAQFTRLRDLAMKDELTGVWNRRYFNHFLKKILERAATDRQQVTLLVFDIDDFKRYNDAYGHAAGDEILQGVAHLMRSSVREHDVVARIGGDEFAVIFWDAGEEPRKAHSKHPDDVLNAAKRFQQAVIDHRFPKLLDQAAGTLTISGGLAGFPWDGRTPEELLEAADTMAMQSKQQGKNAITFGPGAQVDPDPAP